ncbi:KATNB1-like protein 1 [Lampris incognitus]|uniref:KATNB1-like protein 1 n=1 Tax=Lampris incognitus TaxID=2546036 RepID=UPI0024B5A93F|nr:KATNB1-like protein 1 [Lampris incognitus]XP_056150693.1 KATNB1-like protein 1 [Lampris incognitus]
MKQVDFLNKEELAKDRYLGTAKQVSLYTRKRHQVEASSLKVCCQSSRVGWACDTGMANKENELTCSEDLRSVYYNDNCGLPVNSVEASKMTGVGSKYSDHFTELSKDHEAMTHVLFGRNLRLNVALTLWRRNASELVAYLIRIEDKGVLLDCLPVLTKNLQDEAPCVSLGCCVDLLPQLKVVLASKYEEHIIVGLHWVRSVIRKWWPELSTNGKSLQDTCSEDRNIEIMKQRLKDLWKEGTQLCLVPGTTGEVAKAIESYLSQLP